MGCGSTFGIAFPSFQHALFNTFSEVSVGIEAKAHRSRAKLLVRFDLVRFNVLRDVRFAVACGI
jgi:hypothetical protein